MCSACRPLLAAESAFGDRRESIHFRSLSLYRVRKKVFAWLREFTPHSTLASLPGKHTTMHADLLSGPCTSSMNALFIWEEEQCNGTPLSRSLPPSPPLRPATSQQRNSAPLSRRFTAMPSRFSTQYNGQLARTTISVLCIDIMEQFPQQISQHIQSGCELPERG